MIKKYSLSFFIFIYTVFLLNAQEAEKINNSNIIDINKIEGVEIDNIDKVEGIYTTHISVTDYDGNEYQAIHIGNQIWMKENLKTTHYAGGTALVNGTGAGGTPGDITTKYYFAYDDNESNVSNYGRLYTWAAVMNGAISSDANPSGVQGICPTGWHVPSDSEIKELEMFLGMSQADADDNASNRGTDEGSKLAGNVDLWNDGILENDAEFGTYGFMALPGGIRDGFDGSFDYLGYYAYFISATEYASSSVWGRALNYNYSGVTRSYFAKHSGYSVRCLKSPKASIGDFRDGGVVFWVDPNDNDHGLVCAETDQSSAIWGCYETLINASGSAVGTGQANTTAIITVCTTVDIAAKICDDLILNGYSDWFLPSKDELGLMYSNLKENDIGGFANYFYWSSTENSNIGACSQDFDSGTGTQYDSGKYASFNVRAVRAF